MLIYDICLQTTLCPAGPAISRAESSKANVKVQTHQLPCARLLLVFFSPCARLLLFFSYVVVEEDENIFDWFAFSAVCHKPGSAPASLRPVRSLKKKIHNLCTVCLHFGCCLNCLNFGYYLVVNPQLLLIAFHFWRLAVTQSTTLNNYVNGIFTKPEW